MLPDEEELSAIFHTYVTIQNAPQGYEFEVQMTKSHIYI